MWNSGFGSALCIFKSARVSELPPLGDALLAENQPSLLVCLREQPFVAPPSRLMPPPTQGHWGTNP
uniref:Uncharacterized protein n=1 Tax=Cebus imitator TaxID=2715852 RepID=A0A2K5PBB6_CEBIM